MNKNTIREISKDFQFRIRGTSFKQRFQKLAHHAVNDLYGASPVDADFRVRIEPLSTQKQIYAVSIQASVDGEQTVVIKKGKRIHQLLSRCKRVILKVLRRKKSEKRKRIQRRPPAYRLRPSDLAAS